MKRDLVNRLRSPVDGGPLRLEDASGGDEISDGDLVDGAGSRFPIVGGVPQFAADLSEDPTFGYKWRLIGDSYGHEGPSRRIRRQWYLDRFGFPDDDELHAFLRDRETVLDGGCGSGVDTAFFAESGATVIAVDLNRDAAAAVYRRLGGLPNVHVLQGDIQHLPFAPETFGYISSDQVLHHTPDTRQSFLTLARLLRPDGSIAIYVYRRKGPIREFVDDYLRDRTTAMSAEECFRFSEQVTELGRSLSALDASIHVPAIPLLEVEDGEDDVQRFIYWNVIKCFWNDEYDFAMNAVVNFDWYHPRYAFRHTADEVQGWFAEAGVSVERLDTSLSGISIVGRRST